MQAREIEWGKVKRVLVVRLRSIGDTVLATPALIALRRFLPDAQIDILLEDWVAPLLENFPELDSVISVGKSARDRLRIAWKIRRTKYDVVFNLHGGTTSTFFVALGGAKHRVGFANYQYNFLYNQLLSSSSKFWNKQKTHSAEQQLALPGYVGIPVSDCPRSRLCVSDKDAVCIEQRLTFETRKIALLHPVAAFMTKQWSTKNFADVAEFLDAKGFSVVAVATEKERGVLDELVGMSSVAMSVFDDFTLPQMAALAKKAAIFVGNDSGVAHMAAAVQTPSVVIFGSSNRAHWHPWTDAPYEIVFKEFECQPCAGYACEKFDEPKCILSVTKEEVFSAIDRVLLKTNSKNI